MATTPALCIVNPYEHGGGAEYQISLLIEALADAGRYDIHYLTHFVDTRTRTRRYQVVRIGRGGMPRLGYLMDGAALYAALRAIAPRAIYQRVACAYTGICAWYARRHGSALLWHVAHDTDVAPQSLDPGRNFLRIHLERWAVNYGARRAGKIIVQTAHQAALLRTNFARDADAVIPNFHPPATETLDKSGPFTVLWIANLKPWKRPDVFVRLAAAFRTRRDVRFVMVGAPAGTAANRRWQESLMQQIEGMENLEFVGERSHDEVNEMLARAQVFVNTSIHEGFPNTFIQAWLRDVVIVSLSVDPDDVLADGAGIIAHSEAGLATAVGKIIDDPDVRATYAARGRRHAAANHSLRNVAALVRFIDANSGAG
jgi:glycosyltransferase involved in cell wall biosynthesis